MLRIVNINYRAQLSNADDLQAINFSTTPPIQKTISLNTGGVVILFRSGKCRIMGLKQPITRQLIPYNLKSICLQSATLVTHVGHDLNLN